MLEHQITWQHNLTLIISILQNYIGIIDNLPDLKQTKNKT
jgi:hypothetical protein